MAAYKILPFPGPATPPPANQNVILPLPTGPSTTTPSLPGVPALEPLPTTPPRNCWTTPNGGSQNWGLETAQSAVSLLS